MNGVGNRAPFLMTRSAPPCWQTKMRPSGAIAIAVGLDSPEIAVSVKFAGSVAAWSEQKDTRNANERNSTKRIIEICHFCGRSETGDYFRKREWLNSIARDMKRQEVCNRSSSMRL